MMSSSHVPCEDAERHDDGCGAQETPDRDCLRTASPNDIGNEDEDDSEQVPDGRHDWPP